MALTHTAPADTLPISGPHASELGPAFLQKKACFERKPERPGREDGFPLGGDAQPLVAFSIAPVGLNSDGETASFTLVWTFGTP